MTTTIRPIITPRTARAAKARRIAAPAPQKITASPARTFSPEPPVELREEVRRLVMKNF